MIHSITSFLTPTGDLVLKEQGLSSLPHCISHHSNSIIQLDLRNNNLTYLNDVISCLSHLRSLDLRYNTLETLPDSFSSLVHLKILRLDNNNLSSLPQELFSLTSLTILTLNKNSLCSLSPSIKHLKNLQSLIISSNYLKSLPDELGCLRRLRLLYIHGNEFTALPTSLFHLFQLCEFSLEWFRYTAPPLPRVLKNKIGETIIDSFRDLCQVSANRSKKNIELGDLIRHFSEDSMEINRIDMKNRNALHVAVISGDVGVVNGLIAAGCSVNALDSDGLSPLMIALKESNIRAAGILIEVGADLKIGGGCFGSVLNLAVIKSEPKLVKRLLEAGLSPNTVDFRGNTCLHSLFEVFDKQKHRNTIIADLLLAYGANIYAVNQELWTAVHLAAKEKQVSALKYMKKKNFPFNFDLNTLGGKGGWTVLHIASHSGDYTTAETLITLGVDPCVKNYEGKTAKEIARGNLALFKYLTRIEREAFRIRGGEENKLNDAEGNKGDKKIYEEYRQVYEAFKFKEREKVEELTDSSENLVVRADAVYLTSLFRERDSVKVIYRAKRNKEIIVKLEVMNAMEGLKGLMCSVSQSLSNLKIHRPLLSHNSLPGLIELVEEETRIDTLLVL